MTTKPAETQPTKPSIFNLEQGKTYEETKYTLIGEGASLFAKEMASKYRIGTDSVKAFEFAQSMMEGTLDEHKEPRVKRCQACGYYFRDKTRPGNALVCSRECKNKKDGVLDAERKRLKSGGKKRISAVDKYYVTTDSAGNELEYPFFLDCEKGKRSDIEIMTVVDRDRMNLAKTDNYEAFADAVTHKHNFGKRKITMELKDTKKNVGRKRTITARTQVSDKSARTSKPMRRSTWNSEDYEVYRNDKYGEYRLYSERRNALHQAISCERWSINERRKSALFFDNLLKIRIDF